MRMRTSGNRFLQHLKFCKRRPDVTLVINNWELPAHRQVLSEQSDYFLTMFSSGFMESNSNRIVLKETILQAFKRVLEYIYTGSTDFLSNDKMSLHNVFEVYLCAQFYLVNPLASTVFSYIKNKGKLNPRLLLNNALAYSVDELISYATDLILNDFFCYDHTMFYKMSPLAVIHLLKLRLNAIQSEIFEALVYWMRQNSKYSSEFPKLLEHIELHLLNDVTLDWLFKPKRLIDPDFVQKLKSQQEMQAFTVQKTVNSNSISDFRIVEGSKYQSGAILITSSLNRSITLDLNQKFTLNCIKFKLVANIYYTVSVSPNMQNWHMVTDYSQYLCSGQQVIYFRERAVRFIRIQCIMDFKIEADVEAIYFSGLPKIDAITNVIIPVNNLIPNNAAGSFLLGKVNEHIIEAQNGHIVYQFSQPYIIGSMMLLFEDLRNYSITVKGSDKWVLVFQEDDAQGRRLVSFPEQPVVYVKIEGGPVREFSLSQFECPAHAKSD